MARRAARKLPLATVGSWPGRANEPSRLAAGNLTFLAPPGRNLRAGREGRLVADCRQAQRAAFGLAVTSKGAADVVPLNPTSPLPPLSALVCLHVGRRGGQGLTPNPLAHDFPVPTADSRCPRVSR